MKITLRSLRYFVEVARWGSLSEASRHLNVSASSLASAIDRLEEDYDVRLFVRRRARGMTLTPTGYRVLTKAKHLLDEAVDFENEATGMAIAYSGTLTVGYFAPMAAAFLPQIVADILEKHPNVSVNFDDTDPDTVQKRLLSGELDLGIFYDWEVHPEIRFEHLAAAPAYVLFPKGDPIGDKRIVSLADLSNKVTIIVDYPMDRDYFRALFEADDYVPPIISRVTSPEMVRGMVASGLGYSILNMRPLTNIAYNGLEIDFRPLKVNVRTPNLIIGHPAQIPLRRLARLFVESCKDLFSSDQSKRFFVTE